MRRAILHIGMPKAGSTTIQGFLGDYRQALAKRGVDVPDFGHPDVIHGPIELGRALKHERDPAAPESEPWRRLDRHLDGVAGDVCISREALCRYLSRRRVFEFTHGFFRSRGFGLSLVAYVRDQADRFNAAYTQAAKKLRAVDPFDVWCERALTEDARRLAHGPMFVHALAAEDVALHVRPLNEVGGEKLIADFCERLGVADLDVAGFDPTPHRNATPGPMATLAGMLVGRALAERGIDPEVRPNLSRDFNAMARERGWNEAPFYGPSPEMAARIRARFAADDDKLAVRLWGSSWSGRVPPTSRAQNVLALEDASPEQRRAIENLVQEFLAHATRRPFWRRAFAPRKSA